MVSTDNGFEYSVKKVLSDLALASFKKLARAAARASSLADGLDIKNQLSIVVVIRQCRCRNHAALPEYLDSATFVQLVKGQVG